LIANDNDPKHLGSDLDLLIDDFDRSSPVTRAAIGRPGSTGATAVGAAAWPATTILAFAIP